METLIEAKSVNLEASMSSVRCTLQRVLHVPENREEHFDIRDADSAAETVKQRKAKGNRNSAGACLSPPVRLQHLPRLNGALCSVKLQNNSLKLNDAKPQLKLLVSVVISKMMAKSSN